MRRLKSELQNRLESRKSELQERIVRKYNLIKRINYIKIEECFIKGLYVYIYMN